MKQGEEEWVLGLNEDRFNFCDTYHSKEEAIDVGRKELMNAEPYNPKSYTSYSEVFHNNIDDDIMCFYVGRLIRPEPKADIDNIIEDLVRDAVYIYDEYYNGFLGDVTKEQKKDLEKEINKVIQCWLNKYNLRDYGYLVDDVEQVKV